MQDLHQYRNPVGSRVKVAPSPFTWGLSARYEGQVGTVTAHDLDYDEDRTWPDLYVQFDTALVRLSDHAVEPA